MKDKLIAAGCANMKEFGYTGVNAENITTDEVYKMFFKSMLEENKGIAGADVDKAINELIAKCSE